MLLISLVSQVSYADKLLILGDSLSAAYGMQQQQGWPALLQQNTDWQLINGSISGETTSGGLARLPALLAEHQPDVVLIALGGNDGLRGFSVELIQANLNKIITLVRQHNAEPLLMQIRIPPNYGPRYVRQFTALYPQLAEKHDISLWPFFMDSIAINSDLMMADGIHPNVAAQLIISEFMADLLNELQIKE